MRLDRAVSKFIADGLKKLGITVVHITPDDAQRYYESQFAPFHRDRFDRMIIAQSASLGFTLVSNDADFPAYEARGIVKLLRND